MNKKSISKKHIRVFNVALAAFFFGYTLSLSLGGFLSSNMVSAEGTTFVFYYNADDPATKANTIEAFAKDQDYNSTYKKDTSIIVKNGPGGKDSVLNYDAETTNKAADGTFDFAEYFFTKTFYCTLGDHKITDTKPTGTEKYAAMLYTVGLRLEGEDLAQAKKTFEKQSWSGEDTGAGITQMDIVQPSTDGGKPNTDNSDVRTSTLGVNIGKGDVPKILAPRGCELAPAGDINILNYGKMSAADREKYKALIAIAKNGPSGSAGGGKGEPDCDTQASSPLSWIACPLIDAGVALTDRVFKDFVQPLLEDVPVSTDKNDGSFKAWSNFRVIANVLLVGSLLVIVYSQAKGGGGR